MHTVSAAQHATHRARHGCNHSRVKPKAPKKQQKLSVGILTMDVVASAISEIRVARLVPLMADGIHEVCRQIRSKNGNAARRRTSLRKLGLLTYLGPSRNYE